MSDLSKRHPQRDFADGFRAYKRGEPRDGTTAAWLEGWDAAAAVAERDALREAAQSLARSVSGSWYAFERALRSEIGNTNYNCVAEKLARIDAALNGGGDGS